MRRRSNAPKGKAPEINWDETEDPDCVAEDGWQDEPETPWTCTTCKKYVKMTHLVKLWPREQARISGPRREGLASNCLSSHFTHRYHEVTIAVGVRNARPEIMLYSNMAMVWAEIVLHKDVDWRTVAGRNVSLLDRTNHFIPTSWNGPSDCWPRWSNRRSTDHLAPTPRRVHVNEVPDVQNYGGHLGTFNDGYAAPVTFGAGSGGFHYGNEQYNPVNTTPHQYMPPHVGNFPDTYRNSVDNTPPRHRPGVMENTYDRHYGDVRPQNSYDTYRNPQNSYGGTHHGNTYDTYRNLPREHQQHQGSDAAPVTFHAYGGGTYGNYTTPPPRNRMDRDTEEAEFQRQLHEATIKSQEEYIKKLEDDSRFFQTQYNSLNDMVSWGPYASEAGPSRRYDSDSSDD